MNGTDHDTIVAPATAPGGALAVVRVSGAEALAVCDRIFRGRGKLADAAGYTVHYGRIVESAAAGLSPDADTPTERTIDDVLVTLFRAPHSYTGEDSVEISCHGSQYIVSELLRLLCRAGARMASPGEFTVRAYLNGKMDLSQAEAVADLIASSSRAAHTLATTQLRGGYSADLEALRERLLELVSLLELELDFSEEEVEFADRTQLRETMEQIDARIEAMRRSFTLGNAIKQGVAVAIVGAPNAGKSTLLAAVSAAKPKIADYPFTTMEPNLGIVSYYDDKSFVMADIPGIIEGAHLGKGIGLRFLRHIERNSVLLFLIPADSPDPSREYEILLGELREYNPELLVKGRILAISKSDMLDEKAKGEIEDRLPQNVRHIFFSSLTGDNIRQLKDMLWDLLHENNG